MNKSNTHRASKKRHAGHPRAASADSTTALSIVFIRNAAIGLVIALGLALLFLFVATLIIHRATNPDRLVQPAALAVLYLSALLTGFLASLRQPLPAVLSGLISGGLLILAGLLIGFCLPADEVSTGYALLSRLPIFPLSVCGAFLAKYRPRKRRRRRR